MVIEYKIKFEEDGVRVIQIVHPDAINGNEMGGNPGVPTEDGGNPGVDTDGGGNPGVPIDDGGNPGVPTDDGGASQGRGRVIAVVLGPLVIGNAGVARPNGSKAVQAQKKPAGLAEVHAALLAAKAESK